MCSEAIISPLLLAVAISLPLIEKHILYYSKIAKEEWIN